MLSLLSCIVHWTACLYHVTYGIYSKFILWSYLNVKELRVQSKREILSLSVCNRVRTHNYLVRKRTLNYSIPLQSYKLRISRLFRRRNYLNQATRFNCRFALKCVCDMIRTQNQMYHTDKYLQHSPII